MEDGTKACSTCETKREKNVNIVMRQSVSGSV